MYKRQDHKDYIELLKKLRELPNVKKVFIRSGIRFDYVLADLDDTFFYELCEHHVSGQLKVAPEHVAAVSYTHLHSRGDQLLYYVWNNG